MALLVGVTGFAGAGKTTAVEYLADRNHGETVYLGQAILDEIDVRGLPQTRENERLVRLELRRKEGLGVFASRCANRVSRVLAKGTPVFIDAIFAEEEWEVLRRCSNESICLLAIQTSFELRCQRLSIRQKRALTLQELEQRDETEINDLGTDRVIASANRSIANNASLSDFYKNLDGFWESFSLP